MLAGSPFHSPEPIRMNVPSRPLFFLAGGLVALVPLALPPRSAEPPARPEDAALNHWIFDVGDADPAVVRQHALDVSAHMEEAHPEVQLLAYQDFGSQRGGRLHFLLHSVNTTAQQVFINEDYGADEICRGHLDLEDELFELERDLYMRRITSDPEKERRLGRQDGAAVWELRARFPRVGQAVECVRQVVDHLNATYPDQLFAAYDEWYPDSGHIRIYAHNSGISRWEAFEAAMRADPVVRELFEGAAEAFVEGSFDDTWIVRITP
jgi:hypothetical protein